MIRAAMFAAQRFTRQMALLARKTSERAAAFEYQRHVVGGETQRFHGHGMEIRWCPFGLHDAFGGAEPEDPNGYRRAENVACSSQR
jgi:hypothetical protein